MIFQVVAVIVGYLCLGLLFGMLAKFEDKRCNHNVDDEFYVLVVFIWPLVIALFAVAVVYFSVAEIIMFCINFGDDK